MSIYISKKNGYMREYKSNYKPKKERPDHPRYKLVKAIATPDLISDEQVADLLAALQLVEVPPPDDGSTSVPEFATLEDESEQPPPEESSSSEPPRRGSRRRNRVGRRRFRKRQS
jgi:hypothetical protein